MHRFLVWLWVSGALLGFTGMLWGQDASSAWRTKVDPTLLHALENGETAEMLVLLHQQPNLALAARLRGKQAKGSWVYAQAKQLAAQTQQPLLDILQWSATSYRSFVVANAIYVHAADLHLTAQLAAHPAVAAVQPNHWTRMESPLPGRAEPSGRDPLEWGVARIQANAVWDLGYTGQGVVVGGQDTGYEWDHPAIQANYRGWDGAAATHDYHWHDAIHAINPLNGDTLPSPDNNPCGLDALAPCDDHNHGTHTMGTIVGSVDDLGSRIGVAPGARWIGCRNMERGWGSPASYLEGFEWFLAPTDLNGANPRPDLAPHVINNSWSCPEVEGCNPDNWGVLETAVNTLRAAGVVVVVSAGNSGSGCSSVNTPAAIFAGSFAVGATRANDTIAGFSSRGPVLADGSLRLKPNLTAPGVNVRSAIRGGGFANFSGTSMAGPHVAGAVALLISAVPQLAGEVDSIEAILQRTAVPKLANQDCGDYPGQQVPNAVYGYGRLDILAAVEEALRTIVDVPEPPASRQVWLFPNPAHNWAMVQWNENDGWEQLELWSPNGQLLSRRDVAGAVAADLPLEHLARGLYIYRLRNAHGAVSGKLLVE